jgi:hypothetical protein
MNVELRDTIEKEVHNAVQSTRLPSLLDARLDGPQRNIQENPKVLSESQLAKIDENITDTFKFKKMGNFFLVIRVFCEGICHIFIYDSPSCLW